MTTLSRAMRLEPSAGVLAAGVGQETVLLDPACGRYFSLNEVAARIWQLIGCRAPLGEIHATLLAEYDVDSELLWGDIERLAAELAGNRLAAVRVS